jgi:Flp pilus assembly protein TadG
LKLRLPWSRRNRSLAADKRGAHMLELAIVFPVFMTFLLVLFEVAYDQFLLTELQGAVQLTSYQVQVGNTTNTASAKAFVDNDLCSNVLAHALACSNLYVRVQEFNPAVCSDFHLTGSPATNGSVPVSGGVLQLGDYAGESAGVGSNIGPTACGGNSTGFCNAPPSTFIILTAIYVAPSFLGGLITGTATKYNGNFARGIISTSAFYTEGFKNPVVGTTNQQVLQCAAKT